MVVEEPQERSQYKWEPPSGMRFKNPLGLTMEKIKTFVPEDERELKLVKEWLAGNVELVAPPRPQVPVHAPGATVRQKLKSMQKFIEAFQYNYTSTNYFNVNKFRPLNRVLDNAKHIIKEALPIKCIEAVFLSIYLTQGITQLERFPIIFKSSAGDNIYRHIVLGIKHNNKYGCLGLSRRKELMYKDLVYDSFSELIQSFIDGYHTVLHRVVRVRIGLPVSHDIHSVEPVCWQFLTVNMGTKEYAGSANSWGEAAAVIDYYGKEMHRLLPRWRNDFFNMCNGGGEGGYAGIKDNYCYNELVKKLNKHDGGDFGFAPSPKKRRAMPRRRSRGKSSTARKKILATSEEAHGEKTVEDEDDTENADEEDLDRMEINNGGMTTADEDAGSEDEEDDDLAEDQGPTANKRCTFLAV